MAAEMVRVNTRISKTLNDWLDKQSDETGLPKSTIIMLAVEEYWRNKEVIMNMGNLGAIMAKLEEVQGAIEEAKK